jgi:hypothetical protein
MLITFVFRIRNWRKGLVQLIDMKISGDDLGEAQ